jgi:tetratricopeptide (TPR) repeat protein
MPKKKPLKSPAVMSFLKKGFTLYLALFILSWVLVDYDQIKTGAKIRTSSFFKPSTYNGLIRFHEGEGKPERKQLKDYAYYYQKLIDYNPELADAHVLLGYCLYSLGRPQDAKNHYQTAVDLNPPLFWAYYNLGVIHFQQKDYRRAIDLFQQAVGKHPQHTVGFMQSSDKVFVPLLKGRLTQPVMLTRLREGYRHAYLLLTLSHAALGDYLSMQRSGQQALIMNVGDKELFTFLVDFARRQQEGEKSSSLIVSGQKTVDDLLTRDDRLRFF